MRHEPIFNWSEESGLASCILTDGVRVYTGFAQCHPDDKDMMSEKVGCEIALRRAKINALCGYRDELKITLKTLNSLYYSMNSSNRFNEKSYENKMLQRRIRATTFDLDAAKEMIANERENLRLYIQGKDKFYRMTRTRRDLASYN